MYNIVEGDSPIFHYCAIGDLSSMRRLFRSGEAAPLDTTGSGETLLDVSIDGTTVITS
jgi:hypothetical protein